MSRLWVPPKVDRELQQKTQEHTAQVMAMVDRFRGILSYWTRELKQKDPDLEMIFAPPTATAAGLIPGRYHVMKHIPGAPPALLPITGPDGEFVEPTSQIMEKLAENDLQNIQAVDARRRAMEAEERARERDRERDAELRREELVERWKAATQTRVSMNRDAPWSQNVAGRRAVQKKKAA